MQNKNLTWGTLLLALGLLALAGCSPMERQQVPVWQGIRLDEYIDTAALAPVLTGLQQQGTWQGQLQLEILAHADSATGLPYLNRTCLHNVAKLLPMLHSHGWQYSLCLAHNTQWPLFLPGLAPAPQAWFAAYQAECRLLAQRTAAMPPQRVVLGTACIPLNTQAILWAALADSMRPSFPGARLTYAAPVSQAPYLAFWQELDEVALYCEQPPDGNNKTLARARHPAVARLADSLHKPVYIAYANALGPDKLLALQNRLRYWPGNVEISGICLNSIFIVPPAADSISPFGGATDPAFLDYLRAYGGKR